MRYKYRRRIDGLDEKPVNLLGMIPPRLPADYRPVGVAAGEGELVIRAAGAGERVVPPAVSSATGRGEIAFQAVGVGNREVGPTTGRGELVIRASGTGLRTPVPPSASAELIILAVGLGDNTKPIALRSKFIAAGRLHSIMIDGVAVTQGPLMPEKNVVTASGNVALSGGRNIVLPE